MAFRAAEPHQTELSNIPRDGRLRRRNAGTFQALDELVLGRHRMLADDRKDGFLPLTLGHWQAPPARASVLCRPAHCELAAPRPPSVDQARRARTEERTAAVRQASRNRGH